ncbi:alpha/beta fold hydrolase [Aliivibrio fischeri]|uniref:Alpha/beta fold hydrolase n=1 Tax=Aliivibrio fischeri TaxID=668 RepID=A0A510UTF0_ALIFS|nr:alpha/beta hydrolase [Aliivibrio fischeri]MUK48756.1 alpha/beta fold hydrolase [Aliivibrio fischeri]GEK16115.1 alpha/beta hydrolase [Aliivibrio fischeri]
MIGEIILLRGLFRGCYHWGDFPKKLQSVFPKSVVTCIDIPGNGYLSSKTSPETISGMVESVRLQCRSKGGIHILAISMGGMIGLKWAELYPEEIESVICINTSAKGFSPFYERLLPRNYLKVAMALVSRSFDRERAIYQMVSNQPVDFNTVHEWANYSKRYPMSVYNFWRQLSAARKFQTSRPECELHFIVSLKDKLVNCKATKAIASSWNIPVIMNEMDGHDIALDNSEWLVSTVSSIWLRA